MERNSTLSSVDSKIKRYTALAGGMASMIGVANAQVMYTDVDPDETITPGGTAQYDLDFDNDGTVDMIFAAFAGSVTGIYTYGTVMIPYTLNYQGAIATVGTAAAATNGWMGTSAPSAVASAASIGAGGSFQNTQGAMNIIQSTYFGAPYNTTFGPNTNGNHATGADQYMGARFDISGATHYGWVRVTGATDGSSLTIHDYAYDATAGTAIAAGDMGSVGLNEIESQINIFGAGGRIIVANNAEDNGSVNVMNLSGQVVANEALNAGRNIIDGASLATGVYLVEVTVNDQKMTKKVYVR